MSSNSLKKLGPPVKPGVDGGAGAAGFDGLEADAFKQGAILGGGAFAAFGAGEHVEGLEEGVAGAGVVVVEEGFGQEESAAGGESGVDFAQEGFDFGGGPVVDDAAEGVEVGRGQRVGEEVSGDAVDAGNGIGGDDGGQVEDAGGESGPVGAGGGGEVAGAAAEIAEMVEAAEIERRDDLRGGEQAEAVHALLEGAQGFGRAEEVAEDVGAGVELEGLGPAVGAFADGVGEVGPKMPEDVAGVEHVAGEGFRA
ncbi:MAG: hypothetical protein LW650_15655 [Planctomycetaceae bacterium]|nr:hypothetical protein [Planctomycetaceae bacterium]